MENLYVFAVVPHAGTWIEITNAKNGRSFRSVVPHAGTWIEIVHRSGDRYWVLVVPHAGTWIEITRQMHKCWSCFRRSPRGNVDWNRIDLIYDFIQYSRSPRGNVDWNIDNGKDYTAETMVVPHAGTWIEIDILHTGSIDRLVVPHAGTWIEIQSCLFLCQFCNLSFPTRERGLKSDFYSPWAYQLVSFPTRERGLK